jgi:uncharacterized membrane protein
VKDNNWIIALIVLALLALIPWGSMMGYGSGWGLCGMMGNWNYGSGGYGIGRMISWTTNVALLVLAVLGIVWLIRKIQEEPTRKK